MRSYLNIAKDEAQAGSLHIHLRRHAIWGQARRALPRHASARDRPGLARRS